MKNVGRREVLYYHHSLNSTTAKTKHAYLPSANTNTYPPLNGGITAISSVDCREMMASRDSSMYSQFNANNMLFCIGSNLQSNTFTHYHHQQQQQQII